MAPSARAAALLQRSRARESAEGKENRDERESRKSLQRSRARESAEGASAKQMRRRMGSFNGAALVRARRAELRAP